MNTENGYILFAYMQSCLYECNINFNMHIICVLCVDIGPLSISRQQRVWQKVKEIEVVIRQQFKRRCRQRLTQKKKFMRRLIFSQHDSLERGEKKIEK